ncbi:MAG: AsmA family protein [Acidobacteria bacterium]|nr:AsmA family protein [Acidobacteriota bacterium]
MRVFLSKRALAFSLAALLALFLVRPPMGLMRRRVIGSLGIELGRPVGMSSVHLRFLPRPGLELEGFTIYDTEFGAEPLLRAAHVVAWLRLSSLARTRLEFSSLSLDEVSLNLSRNAEGHWNIERLLERASQSSTAPTASSRKEARREFPYIEADHARINFKNGPEKTHYALTQAEFALWQASEDDWGMRLRATPIRTDQNLTDTGVVRAEGTWHRSRELRDTPFQFSLEWKEAQLGQLSKLVWGADQGWRGGFLVKGKFAGTPGHFRLAADLGVDQLRRQDILSGGNLQFATHCAAQYSRDTATLSHLDCGAPFGDGSLELRGTARVPFPSAYNLTLAVKGVQAESALEVARQVSQAIPPDLHAIGRINMVLSQSRQGVLLRPQSRGKGEVVGLELASARSGSRLAIPTVPLKLEMAGSHAGSREAGGRVPELQIGPMEVDAGRPLPLGAELAVSPAGYRASIRGEAAVERLERGAAMFGIAIAQVPAEGSVGLNLGIFRRWSDRSSAVHGTAQLHAVRAEVRGLNTPLEIRRADLAIGGDSVRVTNVEASAGEALWRGSLEIPRPCALPAACTLKFRLHSPEASAAGFNNLFNPRASKPWYRLFRLGSSGSFFARIKASGSVAIDRLLLGGAVAERFSGDLNLDHGRVSLANMRSSFLGGRAAGSMRADFSERPPVYSGSGSLEGVSLEAVSALVDKDWAQGSASAAYGFKSSGWSIGDVVHTAELDLSFQIQDGTFPHIALRAGADPLHASRFSGMVSLRGGRLSFRDAALVSSRSVFTVSGTASLAGALKLTMTGENSSGYALSGTVDETRVRPIPGPPTQAALKP